jgi:hypothetical protein
VAAILAELMWLRFAVASYTEGLKARGGDVVVNTQLYTNRAAAQFHIGNYRYRKNPRQKTFRMLKILCV